MPTEQPPLVAKLVPTFVVSVTDPYGRILGLGTRTGKYGMYFHGAALSTLL
jgi:hypothetical protein